MPRKRRTANSEKALKLWIAPEWSPRLRESSSSSSLSGDFSRYLDLADRVLANDSKDTSARPDGAVRRPKSDERPAANPNGKHVTGSEPVALSEALLSRAVVKVTPRKPPRHPPYPKPPKLMASKLPAMPNPPKPPKANFPKPPRRDW